MAMTFEIRGGPELQKQLRKLTEATRVGAMEAAATAGAMIIMNAAKGFAPVRTGNLRRSIHTETVLRSPQKVTVSVGTDVIYAKQREYGGVIVPRSAKMLAWQGPDGQWHFARRVYQKPTPFMRPAFDTRKAAAEAAAVKVLIRAAGLAA